VAGVTVNALAADASAAAWSPVAVEQALAVAVLLAARLLPLALLVPWLAVRRAPVALSLAITVVLVLCLHAPAAASAPALPFAAISLAALALRELLVGLVYALPLALPLHAIEWSGTLSGRAFGAPGADRALASLLLTLSAALFFALGGHRVALRLLAGELARSPLGQVAAPRNPLALVGSSVQLLADAFALALVLALPAIAALFMSELGVALAARGSGARSLPLLLPSLRPLLWLAVTWIGVALLVQGAPGIFEHGLRAARALWGAW
jgi:type III secretion protein T